MADRYRGGAVHVDLDGVEDAGLLASEAAAALGVVAATAEQLAERLNHGEPALLLLDGFDRFLDDAGEVARLLAAVPSLTVLATSRAALRVSGEHVYPVQPLVPAERRRALRRPRRGGTRRLGAGQRSRRRHLRAARRPAARDRARGRPGPAALAAGPAGAARAPPGRPDGRPRRPPAAAPLAARNARVVVGRARRGRTAAPLRADGVRGRRVARRGGGRLRRGGADVDAVVSSLLDKSSLLRSDPREPEPRLAMLDTVREFAAERADRPRRHRAPACALLRRLLRAAREGGRPRAPARLARAARAGAGQHPPRLRAACARRRRRRGASRGDRLRPGAAVGRAHPGGARLARARHRHPRPAGDRALLGRPARDLAGPPRRGRAAPAGRARRRARGRRRAPRGWRPDRARALGDARRQPGGGRAARRRARARRERPATAS